MDLGPTNIDGGSRPRRMYTFCRHRSGVIRSTLVVDEKGKIAEAHYNVKPTGHVAKLRRDLSA